MNMDWIKLQDRKPQDHERCLAIHPKRSNEYKVTIARWYEEYGCFIEDMQDYGFYAEYWMPIELPSENEATIFQRIRDCVKNILKR